MKATKKYEFDPDYAIPPGETLKEIMESLEMSQKELSKRSGLTVQSLNRIIKGEQPVTYDTANILELVTGVPAKMWNNLEVNYREQLAKIQELELFKQDIIWLKDIPVNELKKRGMISDSKDNAINLRDILEFYGVGSVAAWKRVWEEPKVAAKRSVCFETLPGYASAWIRLGELQGHAIKCKVYDKKKFESALKEIRRLTTLKPREFIPKMRELCAEAGVALALVPEMEKVPWNGATKWLKSDKAMILLSLRGKSEDFFWFSFFHEACHVLYDNKKDLYINNENKDDPKEVKADSFASNYLIPLQFKQRLTSLNSKEDVKKLAYELGICTGIVVGQFEHLTKKWGWFKELKCKFSWTEK
jgi:HTH-type transcriptional regulator / antitoxin HigA